MKMNMKKIFSWGMMLAAAFTLTNCTKEIDAPVQEPESVGYPFEIIASTADTKTVNDGMSTKWVAGDQINLFHALGESANYVNDGAFTVSDVEAGIFTGTINAELDVEEEYNWYVLYPYNEKVTTPGEKTAGYTYIGYSSGLNQSGYDSMASLKGSVCPLYGIAKYAGVRPEITMNHLSSIVAINVTNKNKEPLTIAEASFTATEDIVGSYYIDITGKSVVYTPSSANYVKNTALVNVSGGTPLAQGESAIIYAAIKPFTAAAGQKLTLSVNGYSKEIELTKDVTFTAGKIKTLNFGYDKPEAPEVEGTATATLTFDASKVNRLSYSTTEQVWFQNGITFTNSKESSTTNIGDYGNPVRLYKSSKFTIKAPGNITKIVFNSAANESDDSKKYLDFLKTAVGNNVVDGTKVTVELDGTSSSVTYTMPGQVRLYDITVTYLGEAYVPPTIESLEISGDYQTVFTQGDTFAFGGTVTAKYDDESTRDVTTLSNFSGYDMNEVGTQTVTVSYEGKSATYDIEVKAPVLTDKKQYTFTITKDDFNSTSYAANNNEKISIATASDGSKMEVKWTSYQVMNQNSTMQWQKSKGYIYNSTNLGTIDNVEIKSKDGAFTTYEGSSAQPTSKGDGGYFKIVVGSATGKVTSITVTFTK